MFYFNGSSCSKCGAELKETDDIVACPVCGSPHHRECYNENGGCANEHLHEEGFSWKRDSYIESEAQEKSEESRKVIYCGICGAENNAGRLYCHNCGKPLFDDSVKSDSDGSPYSDFNRQNYDFSDKETIDGVLVGDMNRFLGGSSMMFTPLFYQMQKLGKKVCFNLIALLFPSFWFLNRKMYFRGILIILFNLLTYCYSALFYGVYSLMYKAAIDFDSDAVMDLFEQEPVIMGGFMVFGLLSYVIAIFSALYGINSYKKWSVRRIKKIRAKHKDDNDYHEALTAHGQSGLGVTLVILLLYFALTLVADRFIPIIK